MVSPLQSSFSILRENQIFLRVPLENLGVESEMPRPSGEVPTRARAHSCSRLGVSGGCEWREETFGDTSDDFAVELSWAMEGHGAKLCCSVLSFV